MAIVQLTLRQAYLGKDIYNVFHYLNLTNVGFGIEWVTGLLNEWEEAILPKINAIQVDGVTNVSLSGVQVENANIQAQISLTGTGGLAVDSAFYLPAAQTYAFRLFVAPSQVGNTALPYVGNRRITDGYKRFAGVSDGLITGGNWLSSFAEGTDVDALEEALWADVNTGVGGAPIAEPIVYGKEIPARGAPGDPDYLPARESLFAHITSANLQPPRWTRRRQ